MKNGANKKSVESFNESCGGAEQTPELKMKLSPCRPDNGFLNQSGWVRSGPGPDSHAAVCLLCCHTATKKRKSLIRVVAPSADLRESPN